MLLDEIRQQTTEALKARDTRRVETLRFLLSAIRNVGIAKYGPRGEKQITDQDIVDVIRKQVKTRQESIEAFSKAGRTDLVEKEEQERAILQSFLPKDLSDEELKALLEPLLANGERHMGTLMKQAMQLVQGRADGKRVSTILQSLLQQ